MTPYLALLFAHSWNRWLVLATGLAALGLLARGGAGRRPWGDAEAGAIRLFLSALDVQVLLGLLLYFVFSPVGFPRSSTLAEVMGNTVTRYFAVEHWSGMGLALVAAHALWVKAKRGPDAGRRRWAAWAVGGALAIILLTLPWPGLPYGRSLFRF